MRTKADKREDIVAIVIFSTLSIFLICGAALSFCIIFNIGTAAPAPIRVLCGLVFILACCTIYIVGGGVCKMIANLAKGKDIV